MSKCYKYEDNEYEIFIENFVFIKDKVSGIYLKNEINSLPKSVSNSLIEYTPKVTGYSFAFFIYSSTGGEFKLVKIF